MYKKIVNYFYLALTLLFISPSLLASNFYENKTITVIVGVPAGSGGDVSARTFMAELQNHIPGNPKIIVRNMAGAGGSKALNYTFEKSKANGLSFYYGNWDPMGVIAGSKGIRYIPEKFGVIGSAANERGTIVRTDIGEGLKKREDIVKNSAIRVGGRSSKNINDMVGNLALRILNVNFRYIPGFKGMSKMAPGILTGELQAGHTAAGGYAKFFRMSTEEGDTMMLYYHPFFDAEGNEIIPKVKPFSKDVPSLSELYHSINGTYPSGIEWETYKWLRSNVHSTSPAFIAPPGTTEESLNILRNATKKTWSNKQFIDKWKSQFRSLPHVNSTEATIAAFSNYMKINKNQLKVVKKLIKLGK